MRSAKNQFIQVVHNPVKFRLFLFFKLPAALFSGIAVKELNDKIAVVMVPYKWFTKNPFKSTYFACLAMGAEMSTGLLAMLYTYKINPPISMLVTGLEASYFKKAINTTSFTCAQGDLIKKTIDEAIKTGGGQSLKVTATGKNNAGELVAVFHITWSFKIKETFSN